MSEEEKNKARMEEEHKIMAGYIDTAKTFTQLSIGALVLSITFMEKFLGMSGNQTSIPVLLLLAWVFWLFAAIAGAFYQYRAIKWLETLGIEFNLINERHHVADLLKVYPYIVYGFLLISFSLGTILFAIFGAMKIL